MAAWTGNVVLDIEFRSVIRRIRWYLSSYTRLAFPACETAPRGILGDSPELLRQSKPPWKLGGKLSSRENGSLRNIHRRMDRIIRALFIAHIVRIAIKNLKMTVFFTKNERRPGTNGILAGVHKLISYHHPHSYLEEGIFPCHWQITNRTLFNKGKRKLEIPSARQPLCLEDAQKSPQE